MDAYGGCNYFYKEIMGSRRRGERRLTNFDIFFSCINFAFFLYEEKFDANLQINNDTSILPNVRLVMRWNDTRGDTVDATNAMIDMICDGVAAFFGPEGSCHVEAIVSQSRNIPMISYVSPFFILSFAFQFNRIFICTRCRSDAPIDAAHSYICCCQFDTFNLTSEPLGLVRLTSPWVNRTGSS